MSRPGSRLHYAACVLLLLTCLHAFGQFEDPESALRRADTALGQGRFDVAQSIYQQVLASNPDLKISSWRCRNIAEANIRATHQNPTLGADWLQRAVNQDPNDVSLRERFGEVLLQSGEPARAARQFSFLVQKNPDNQQYLLALAGALRDSGQYDDSATILSSALQKDSSSAVLRAEYARNLLYQRQYNDAAQQYQQILKSEQGNVEARIGLAKAFSWQGDQRQALEQYQKALVADPGNYDALVGQGFALIWSGRQAEAIPMLERANSRHPENAEVRDALKKLKVANIFTGDVRAGAPQWPILAPSTKRPPEKNQEDASTASNPPASSASGGSVAAEAPISAPAPSGSSQSGHGLVWVFGMGAAVMVAVFILAGFFLFYLPAARNKKEGRTATAARLAESRPEPNPAEQWARLEEFSRSPRVERSPKSYRPATPPPPPATAPLSFSELLPPPPPAKPEIESEFAPPPTSSPIEAATASPDSSPLPTEPPVAQAQVEQEPPTMPEPRLPRRRRGVTSDRPWWRDLSNPDLAHSAQPAESQPPVEPVAELPQKPLSPFLDMPDEIILPADAPNPLTPASEKPSLPEEPPPVLPFTTVLSRALERAGDGQVEESAQPVQPENLEEPEYSPNGNGGGKVGSPQARRVPEPHPSQALHEASVVIVGCGVMVSHYRTILRSAGADVRTFTFWDLAMSSMRKRRADVLLIDGDALDGLTPVQMYTSAQIERYMFGSILVGVSSDEDRSSLPEDATLAHSLTDEDLRHRLLESLQTSL